MVPTIKSLDTLLRERAGQEAAQEVHQLFEQFESDLLNLGYRAAWSDKLDLTHPADHADEKHNLRTILRRLKERVMPAIQRQRGQDAVGVFIKKVDTLQDQLDELSDQINN